MFSTRLPRSAGRARTAAGVLGLVLLVAATAAARASDSAAQLVSSFQSLCMAGPLDFAASDKKAEEMQLAVQQMVGAPPDESGYYSRSKSWGVLSGTPHEFLVSDTHGPKGDFKSCGIRVNEIDAADFRAELVKAMKLGKPQSESASPDGMRKNIVWSIGDRTLTLSDKSPQNVKQGIRLLISNKPL